MVATVIRAVAHFVPPKVVTNEDLSKLMDTSDEWIRERTGIRERHFIDSPSTTTSDLAVAAARDAIRKAAIDPLSVDYIIAATLSPDFYFPGIGTMVQHKLGLGTIPALDIRAQCSGLVYGVACADAFIRSGQARRILLVCAEIQSTVLDLTTRGRDMAVLFGDGAGALVIDAVDTAEPPSFENKARGVIDSLLGGDGSGASYLCLKSPGTSNPAFVTETDIAEGRVHPSMDGRFVFKNAVSRLTETAQAILARNRVRPSELALILPHQANLRINEMVREQLGLPPEKVFNNIERYGNTTAATIPICMSEAVQEGRLKEGDLVLTLAFGAGFTWGANLVRW